MYRGRRGGTEQHFLCAVHGSLLGHGGGPGTAAGGGAGNCGDESIFCPCSCGVGSFISNNSGTETTSSRRYTQQEESQGRCTDTFDARLPMHTLGLFLLIMSQVRCSRGLISGPGRLTSWQQHWPCAFTRLIPSTHIAYERRSQSTSVAGSGHNPRV